MKLNKEQKDMLAGKEGRGVQKSMEILVGIGEAQEADELVKINYAHLMPPDVMFMPYGLQGQWAHDMTYELTQDVKQLKVPCTIEPKFCDMSIAKDLMYSDDVIKEMTEIQGNAANFYEKLGVVPTYTAMPFYYYRGWLGEHVSISESIATLWFNTMFGSRCERDDGVKSLAAAITGYVPNEGAHLDENRHGEVVIRLSEDLNFKNFNDADWDAFSLATSRKCKDKRPVFLGVPKDTPITDMKHLLAVIAVESGLALMHIVGITPEAPTLKAALMGKKPLNEFVIDKHDIDEAYALANTATGSDVDFILMGCPHLTLRELKEVAEELEGKKVHKDVKLIVTTQKTMLEQAADLGYVQVIRNAGGIIVPDMCIAFAGTQAKGTIATNSIKAVFFYAGFSSDGSRKVRFGSTRECVQSAVSGKWEGRK
ncbi:MAG: aconitase X [Desulfobacterales bacterium]|nr:aconitase X [Desulfobacterales bacterium]MDD4072446.1 aconitase X [Desulfobacterales bacterium]MDD4392724.1 aconitase X [Desulfobacterales bacterium]